LRQQPLSLSSRKPSEAKPLIHGRIAITWLQDQVSFIITLIGALLTLAQGKYTWIERSFEESKPISKAANGKDIVVLDSKLPPETQVRAIDVLRTSWTHYQGRPFAK
jgi:hypothetical protein